MYRLVSILLSLFIPYCASELDISFERNDYLLTPYNDLFRNMFHVENAMKLKNQLEKVQYNPVNSNIFFKSPNLLQNSSRCLQDLLYAVNSLNGSDQWALNLFDSYGKPDSGILKASVRWPGDYWECKEVFAPSNPDLTAGNFHGKYCSLTWDVTVSNTTLPITSGICAPDSCSSFELQTYLKLLIAFAFPASKEPKPPINIKSLNCEPTRRLTPPAKAVIALLSLFCTLAVLGSSITAVKYFLQASKENRQTSVLITGPPQDSNSTTGDSLQENDTNDETLQQDHSSNKVQGYLRTMEKFLGCFCLFTNGAKLFNTDSNEGQLLCIHGIRFLSMSWVILGHIYSSAPGIIRNPLETLQAFDTFSMQIIFSGFYAVDSFFVLSGFLLTYLAMQEFAKGKGGISWPYFYIHRYLRLTPVYMLALGFSASVYYYLGSGPFWQYFEYEPSCHKNWWRNLLYINNFKKEQCMPWSWYLANDMQFFVISPLFLITLWRWPKIGYSLLAFFLTVNCVANFVITYKFDLVVGVVTRLQSMSDVLTFNAKYLDYSNKIYVKPYTRIGPYLFGIFTGYIVYKRKTNKTPWHNWITLGVGWAVASGVTLACLFGMYHKDPSLVARSFYNCFSRSLFGAGLSWVIYVCLIEQGGFVNSILSFKMFIPLSRLTYIAYLIHPIIVGTYLTSMKTMLQFSHPNFVFIFLGTMVVTYAISVPVSLIFESPLIILEKMIRRSLSKKQNSSKKQISSERYCDKKDKYTVKELDDGFPNGSKM